MSGMVIERDEGEAPRIKGVVTGALGRMGRLFATALHTTPGYALYGATERHDHPHIGKDVGLELFGRPIACSLENDLLNCVVAANVVIDFTSPDASIAHAKVCADRGIPYVCGTTGMSGEKLAEFERIAAGTRTVFAPNFSVGVNLLIALAKRAARVLGEDFDVEIVEAHHRHKVDAPSGTALALARAVADSLDLGEDAFVFGREGHTGPRTGGKIGVLAVRGGDVVGDHDLHFLGDGERVTLTHKASSRETFVRGALRAALWLQSREPGLYTMRDVLGL